MRIYIIPLVLFSVLLAGCATSQKSTTSKSMDIYGAGVIQHPVIAELDVSENRVTGSASSTRGGSMANIRNMAVADALEGTDADILIEPVFETNREGNRLSATVTGYPASYTNFRSISHEDIPLLEAGVLQTAETIETTGTAEVRETNSRRIFGGLLFLSALIGVGVAMD